MKVDINKIIKLRKANKLTISQMAKYLNKARCTVSCWEHNKTLPSKTDLVAIAQLLGTRISEISDYEDLPISIHQDLKSLKNKMDARSVIQNLNKIVNENKEIPETGINSLKKILHENNRLESVNRTLRKSNTRLISTMSSIHEIIYIKDSKGIFKKVNDKFLEQLKPGYTEEDVIGTKSIDIFGRIEFKEIIPLENKIFKNGQRIINEKIMIPGSVGKSHGLISIEPIFDEVDKVIEIAVSIKDITDIVENIGKLELLESVSNKLDEHIWIITENPLQYKFIGGKEFEKTYGILKNDFINNPSIWLKIVHPEDIAEYKNEQGKFLLPMGENTFRILHKDGSVRWVKYKAFRTHDANNKPLICGLSEDITEEKEAGKIRELLDLSINSMEEVINIWDNQNRKYMFISKSREELYGYSIDMFYDSSVDFWLNCLHPDSRKKEEEYIKINSWPKERTFKILKPNGKIRWVESSCTYTTFMNRKCILFMEKDVTERIKQEESLKFLNDAIASSNYIVWVGNYKYDQEKQFNYTYLTGRPFRLLGVTKSQLKENDLSWGKNIYSLDKAKVQKWFNTENYPRNIEFRVALPNNKIKWVHSKICRKKNNFYGAFYDITERKEQELKREIMERAMNKAEDAMWVYDSDLKCILITKATEKLYGASFNDIENPVQYWVDNILHPEYKNDFEAKFEHYKEQKKKNPFFTPKSFIFKAISSDKTVRYIESIFTCMKYDNEIYDIAVDRDISNLFIEALKIKKIKTLLRNNPNLPKSFKNEISDLLK